MDKNYISLLFVFFISLLIPINARGAINIPKISPSYLIANSPRTFTINVYIPDKNLITNSVRLYKVDNLGKQINFLGYMNDTGNDGDIYAGDKIYSANMTFLEASEDILYLCITGALEKSRNRLSRSFNIPIVSIPNIQSNSQYNQAIDDIYLNLISAQEKFITIKDDIIQPDQFSENLRLLLNNLLSVYANMEAVYDYETNSPSKYPKWKNLLTLKYNNLINAISDSYNEQNTFIANGNDPSVKYIVDWLVEHGQIQANDTDLLERVDYISERSALYTLYRNNNQDSKYHEALDEAATISVKSEIGQFTSITGDGIGGFFSEFGTLISTAISEISNAVIDKFVDIFISKETNEISLAVGYLHENEQLELPSGIHDIIYKFDDSNEKRSILNEIRILDNSVTSVSFTPGQFSRNDGLIAYYPFNGDTNDESGYMNHGIENGGISFIGGVRGQAVNFDGVDDCIQIIDNTNFNLNNSDFTFSSWIYKTTDATDLPVFTLCSSGYGSRLLLLLSNDSDSNSHFWFAYLEYVGEADYNQDTDSNFALQSNGIVELNKWTHYLIRYNYLTFRTQTKPT